MQQLHAVIAASISIKSSQKLKKILEVTEHLCILSNTPTVLYDLSACSSDYLGTWKLHEQQQKGSGVRIQAAEFRPGEWVSCAFTSKLCLPLTLLRSSQLLDTKSTDRKINLLHYIANIIREKYPQVSLFHNELHYVEKAAAGELTEEDGTLFKK